MPRGRCSARQPHQSIIGTEWLYGCPPLRTFSPTPTPPPEQGLLSFLYFKHPLLRRCPPAADQFMADVPWNASFTPCEDFEVQPLNACSKVRAWTCLRPRAQ